MATRYEASFADDYRAFVDFLAERHGDQLFSPDGSTVDEQVGSFLVSSGRTVAVAESCTGGLMSARLTERGGSSEYFLGGAVVYSNEAKVSLADVDPGLIERFGAVSNEVAEALASGATARFGTDYGIGITGIAGPGGGTDEKPVGTVCFSVCSRDGARLTRRLLLPGSRSDIRDRSTTVAMHLLRRLLVGEGAAVPRLRRGRRPAGVSGSPPPGTATPPASRATTPPAATLLTLAPATSVPACLSHSSCPNRRGLRWRSGATLRLPVYRACARSGPKISTSRSVSSARDRRRDRADRRGMRRGFRGASRGVRVRGAGVAAAPQAPGPRGVALGSRGSLGRFAGDAVGRAGGRWLVRA